MKKALFVFILFLLELPSWSQNRSVFKIADADKQVPLYEVNISINGRPVTHSDKNGVIGLEINDQNARIRFTRIGFVDMDTLLIFPSRDTIMIFMTPMQKDLQEVTIISSTRNDQRAENSPVKVEVLGREEMDEESTIKPAGIGSILGDLSGVQIQQSSVVSGNSNVRIQGLDGRYTQILKDGMPLFDGFSGGFGILSMPPLDLGQVELIKGSASTLYGGGAIGGLVNIISRKPAFRQEAVFSINQTTLKETNLNTYLSRRNKKAGYTFFAGYNVSKAVDVNKDGFSDVSGLHGLVIHPRLFFYPDARTTMIFGYTGTFENRSGGDMRVLDGYGDSIHQYFEKNIIDRNSLELSIQRKLSQGITLNLKGSQSSFKRTINSDQINFTGRQYNYYTEFSLLIPYNGNSLVAGINATGDQFKKVTPNIPLHDFENNTLGLFVQNTWNPFRNTTIEFGLRNDHHQTFGDFLLPRLALFHRFNDTWAARAGIGMGYKIPNALATQTTDFSIDKIQNLPGNIRAERSTGYNAEINYKLSWGAGNELFINQAAFLTQVDNPVVASVLTSGDVVFQNQSRPIVTRGFDTYIKAIVDEWEIYAGYTFTYAEKKYLSSNRFVPLTPRNRFAFTLVKDLDEEGWSFGLELSYNGYQYREDYSRTPGYFFVAAMVDKKLGKHIGIVLNGENLLDYRQSKVEALYSGSITRPVFNSLWAPIDGRVINLSLRWKW